MEQTLSQVGLTGLAATAAVVLVVQCVLVVLSSLAGGWLPSLFHLAHTRMQLAISFVGGLMFGIGMFHLLPHSAVLLDSLDRAILWLVFGTLTTFVLLRVFHFHHHEPERHGRSTSSCSGGRVRAERLATVAETQPERGAGRHGRADMDWVGVALGLALHTLVEGAALAACVQSDWRRGLPALSLGAGTFLAIFLHKPLDALSVTWLLQVKGWSARAAQGVNLAVALMCPLGAALFLAGVRLAGATGDWVVGVGVGFAAGVFLCISMSDLLPEVEFHAHDRLALSLAIGAGVLVAYLLVYLEPASVHGHETGVTGPTAGPSGWVVTVDSPADRATLWPTRKQQPRDCGSAGSGRRTLAASDGRASGCEADQKPGRGGASGSRSRIAANRNEVLQLPEVREQGARR